MSKSKIIERIEQEAGVADLVGVLAQRLSPTDLQSLLLEVYRQRTEQKQAADILSDYETNRFARPSTASPLALLEWERSALAQLPADFQAIELAPVCPLGTNSVTAGVDQNWALSTIRNTEVVSDSTNVLALECALIRRQALRANPKSKVAVHRAASHRLLRAQRYTNPNTIPHFSAFALCSAGQDQGNSRFELATLAIHIGFYIRALRVYLGDDLRLRAAITDFSAESRQSLRTEALITALQGDFPQLDCVVDDQRMSGHGYYVDLCFHIYAATASDEFLELADGGVVNWTQKLLSNAKERCVISGIGSERVCTEFARG